MPEIYTLTVREALPGCEAEREAIHGNASTGPSCRAYSPCGSWICTRPPGHSGAHVGGWRFNQICARWIDPR